MIGIPSLCTLREDLPYIRTFTGLKFRHINPLPEDVCIEDIAHHLANICRFSGACRSFYSVAEHSWRVSYICNYENALWGLLHDASEAYCSDLPHPLKYAHGLEGYRGYERLAMDAVCQKFDLPLDEPLDVKEADRIMLATEGRDLMDSRVTWGTAQPLSGNIGQPLLPKTAESFFISRFEDLETRRKCLKQWK